MCTEMWYGVQTRPNHPPQQLAEMPCFHACWIVACDLCTRLVRLIHSKLVNVNILDWKGVKLARGLGSASIAPQLRQGVEPLYSPFTGNAIILIFSLL